MGCLLQSGVRMIYFFLDGNGTLIRMVAFAGSGLELYFHLIPSVRLRGETIHAKHGTPTRDLCIMCGIMRIFDPEYPTPLCPLHLDLIEV